MDQQREAYALAGAQLDRIADRLTNARGELDAASVFVEQAPSALNKLGEFVSRLSLTKTKSSHWLVIADVDSRQSNQTLRRLKQSLGNPSFDLHPGPDASAENLFVVQTVGSWAKPILGNDLSTLPEISNALIQQQASGEQTGSAQTTQAGLFLTKSEAFPPNRLWVFQKVATSESADHSMPALFVVRGVNIDGLKQDAGLDPAQQFQFGVKIKSQVQQLEQFAQNAASIQNLQKRSVVTEPFTFDIGLSNPPSASFPRFWILSLLTGLTATALAFAWKTGQLAIKKADHLAGTLDEARTALHDTRDREAAFFENTGTANCETDAKTGRIVRVNKAMCDLFGYTAEEFLGKTFVEITHPDDVAKTQAFIQDAKENFNLPQQFEKRYLKANGSDFWALVQTKLFVGAYAEGARFLTTIIDISERRAMEVTKNNLVRELAHRVRNTVQLTASMARQTAKSVKNVNEYDSKFRQRLGALSAAQDVLFDAAWDGADLIFLTKRTLAPFESDRLQINMVSLHLSTQHAQTYAIALHELASNSLAFGALATGGTVTFNGEILEATEKEPRRLHLTWHEAGIHGKQVSHRRGFGHKMLFSALPDQFDGYATDSRQNDTYTYECWLTLPAVDRPNA